MFYVYTYKHVQIDKQHKQDSTSSKGNIGRILIALTVSGLYFDQYWEGGHEMLRQYSVVYIFPSSR